MYLLNKKWQKTVNDLINKSKMKRFEYLQIKSYHILDDNRLDRIGHEGYELVSMALYIPENDRYKTEVYVYVFKREIKVTMWQRLTHGLNLANKKIKHKLCMKYTN